MTGEQTGAGGGATAYGVSDEVWREIAVEGQRASAQERRALIRAAGLVAAVVVVASVLSWGGVLTPRLDGGMSSGGSGDAKARTSTLSFELHNAGLLREQVDHFESPLPGLEVVRSVPAKPVVAARSTQHVELTLHATDCRRLVPAARRAGDEHWFGAGVTVVVARPWGMTRTTVTPPSGLGDMALFACGVDPSDTGPTG
ncbi:hypothetical protein ABEG17_04565 [Pedococcus sp. KACC 23699]|uniref:Uncharacterized protein n=1 Tax=Pedococcus sp. KACC 23699 TaxID=3149228 RepID=A0AAU7JWF4_9MICO